MLETLKRIVQEVNASEDLSAALKIIVRRIRQAMNTEVASVYLFDPSRNRYVLMATEGLNPHSVGKVSLSVSEGLVGQVGLREEPINLENASAHPKFHYFKETGEERYHAFLGVPIIHHRKVLGVLVVQQEASRKFDQSEEAFLVTISAQLAAVIAHAEATGSINRRPSKQKKAVRFVGVSGSIGVGLGIAKAVLPLADFNLIPNRSIKTLQIPEEIERFKGAIKEVQMELDDLKKRVKLHLSAEENAIFDVYFKLLDDTVLGGEVIKKIEAGQWAEGALASVIKAHIHSFEIMDDAYLRERAADVKDLGLRILNKLKKSGSEFQSTSSRIEQPCILIGEEITTSHLIEIPREKLAGVVTASGSQNSHMAIVARSLGVPTVVGVLDFPVFQLEGYEIIVDGYRGEVIFNYNEELRKHYQDIMEEERNLMAGLEEIRDAQAVTCDNWKITLWVNTGLMTDVALSLDRGADGVGLYRTEIPFMLQDRFPSEAEQARIYRQQLAAFAPRPVTMRTLDIGGDKSLSYFPIHEENPFLGWRGIRVTLDHPEIFMVQLRAMLKSSEGLDNLRIMLPMISSVFEAEEALHLVHRAYLEVLEEGHNVLMPPVGVMIEVPAAVYQTRELAQRSDFLSVGSNDLTQYLLAVDRNNPRVADLYNTYHPAVLKALQDIVHHAKSVNKPVSICGEMAGDPAAAILLIAMGYDTLSMSASSLLRVKWAIRRISLSRAQKILKDILAMDNAEVIRSYLEFSLAKEGLGNVMRLGGRRSGPVPMGKIAER